VSQTRSTFMSLNQKKKDESKMPGGDLLSSMWLWMWKLVTDITPISHVLPKILLSLSRGVLPSYTFSSEKPRVIRA